MGASLGSLWIPSSKIHFRSGVSITKQSLFCRRRRTADCWPLSFAETNSIAKIFAFKDFLLNYFNFILFLLKSEVVQY